MWGRFAFLCGVALLPRLANAADIEQSLRNLVNAFTGRILPILALGYVAKAAYAYIQGDPNAKEQAVRVVLGTVCLLGLNGVWTFISSQTR